MKKTSPILYSKVLGGHRKEYIEFLVENFDGKSAGYLSSMVSKSPVIYAMVEDSFFMYVFLGVVRSLLGKKTIGLLFRLKPAVEAKTFRTKIKKSILKILKKNHCINTLSILPANLVDGSNSIVDGWIYDFQLWDINSDESAYYAGLKNGYFSSANNEFNLHSGDARKNIVAIGRQDREKGFDIFSDAFLNPCFSKHFKPIVCGAIDPLLSDYKKNILEVGGYIVDRLVSKQEILMAYAAASYVWCVYSRDYDQASGILGRAVQLGVPIIVRSGSLMEKFCLNEGFEYEKFEGADFCKFYPEVERRDCVEKYRAHSINVLNECIWGGV